MFELEMGILLLIAFYKKAINVCTVELILCGDIFPVCSGTVAECGGPFIFPVLQKTTSAK